MSTKISRKIKDATAGHVTISQRTQKAVAASGGRGEDLLVSVGRCLLAYRDVLLATLRGMNPILKRRSLRVMLLWHRAGGLRGLLHVVREVFPTAVGRDFGHLGSVKAH